MQKYLIYILLIINIYLLWDTIKLGSEKIKFEHKYDLIISEKNKQEKYKKIKIVNKNLYNNKINLLAFLSGNGCGICKKKLINKFVWYKNKFGRSFEIVLIGDKNLGINIINKDNYEIYKFTSLQKIFENSIKINQPFILLADRSGKIILSHEMIPGDNEQFNKFNSKLLQIINLIK